MVTCTDEQTAVGFFVVGICSDEIQLGLVTSTLVTSTMVKSSSGLMGVHRIYIATAMIPFSPLRTKSYEADNKRLDQ